MRFGSCISSNATTFWVRFLNWLVQRLNGGSIIRDDVVIRPSRVPERHQNPRRFRDVFEMEVHTRSRVDTHILESHVKKNRTGHTTPMRSETTFPLSPLLAVSALQICGASLDNDRSFSGRASQGSPGSFELDERKNKQPRLEIGRTK